MIFLYQLLVCIPVLLYASYQDLKTRRVTNITWLYMLTIGTPAIFYNLLFDSTIAIMSIIVTVFTVYVFYKIGYFGGADAKCLMVISAIIPVFPVVPLYGIPPFNNFALSVFSNSIFIAAAGALYGIYIKKRPLNYKLPYMLYITAGFITSIIEGDALQYIIFEGIL